MARGKSTATALAASVVTMWGAPSAQGEFIGDRSIRVDVSGTLDVQSPIDNVRLMISGYTYSPTFNDVEWYSLGTITGKLDVSHSTVLEFPFDDEWASRIEVAVIGTHESVTDDGVAIGISTGNAQHHLNNNPFPSTFSNVLNSGRDDPSQLAFHDAIVAGSEADLDRLIFDYRRSLTNLPRYGVGPTILSINDLIAAPVVTEGWSLTFLNFSTATPNGTGSLDISVSLVPEPATLVLCLGLAPLCLSRRGRMRLDQPHPRGTSHGKP